MGATVHLLSHKNGPVGLLVVVGKVKVRMVWTANDLVLTLEAEVFRQEACAGIDDIIVIQRREAMRQKKECDEMTVIPADHHWER